MPTLTITVMEGGTTVPAPGQHFYTLNSTVSGITAQPFMGYTFTGWLLDGIELADNPIDVFMDADHVLTAEFTGAPPPPAQHSLTITTTLGGGTDPPADTYLLDENTVANVHAVPETGYEFKCWLRDGVEAFDNPIAVLMDTNHTLEAAFQLSAVTVPQQDFSPVLIAAGIEAAGIAVTATLSWLWSTLRGGA